MMIQMTLNNTMIQGGRNTVDEKGRIQLLNHCKVQVSCMQQTCDQRVKFQSLSYDI